MDVHAFVTRQPDAVPNPCILLPYELFLRLYATDPIPEDQPLLAWVEEFRRHLLPDEPMAFQALEQRIADALNRRNTAPSADDTPTPS